MDSNNSMCFHEIINNETSIGEITEDIVNNIKAYNIDEEKLEKIRKVVFEAEKNIKLYAQSGEIDINVTKEVFKAKFRDKGPGIENIGLAFQDGYTTADDDVKKLGYGLGNGLSVIRDNVDYLDVASIIGVGTTLDVAISMV